MINQKVLARLVTKMGCEVSTANDGQDAIEQIEVLIKADQSKPPFDLILMDLEVLT